VTATATAGVPEIVGVDTDAAVRAPATVRGTETADADR
jgi:hypothetical protein